MPTTITLTAPSATVVLTGDGVYLGPTYDKLEGWYGVSSDDSGFAKRPDAPGEFEPGQTFAEGRTVSIEGQYFSPIGRADALAMRKTIASLYNSGLPIAMTVADDLETTTRSVYVLDVSFPWTIHQEFAFTIDMRAADPRRYGVTDIRETGLALASAGLDFGAFARWTGASGASTSILTNDGVTALRTNYHTNPSFENGLNNWAGNGSGSIALSTDRAFAGIQSLRVTGGTGQNDGTGTSVVGLDPARTYTASLWVYLPTSGGLVRPVVAASGAAFVAGTAVGDLPRGQWVQGSVTFQPTSTGGVTIYVYDGNSAAGANNGLIMYVDAALVELGTVAGTFFDGDSGTIPGLDPLPNAASNASTYQAVQYGDMSERVVMIVGAVPNVANAVALTLRTSMIQNGVVKSAIARLRDGVTGAILATRTIPDTGDSGTGTTDTWTFTGNVTPVSSSLAVTVQVVNNAAGLYVGPSSLANPPAPGGLDFGDAPSDGRITVVNTGNAGAVTVLKVRDDTGQMTDGFTIVNVGTGQSLTYVGTVTRGTVITLDPKTRQAYVNDVNPVGRFLPSPEWWETPAMSTTTLQFLANGVVTGTPILRAETAAANY